MSTYYNQVTYKGQFYPYFTIEETSENRVSIYVEELSKTGEQTREFVSNIKLEKAFDGTYHITDVDNEIDIALGEYRVSIDKNKNYYELYNKEQFNDILIKRLKEKFSYNIEGEGTVESEGEDLILNEIESEDKTHIHIDEVVQPIANNSFYEYLFGKIQELIANDYELIRNKVSQSEYDRPYMEFFNEKVDGDSLGIKGLHEIGISITRRGPRIKGKGGMGIDLEKIGHLGLDYDLMSGNAFTTQDSGIIHIYFYSKILNEQLVHYKFKLQNYSNESDYDIRVFKPIFLGLQNICNDMLEKDLYGKVEQQFYSMFRGMTNEEINSIQSLDYFKEKVLNDLVNEINSDGGKMKLKNSINEMMNTFVSDHNGNGLNNIFTTINNYIDFQHGSLRIYLRTNAVEMNFFKNKHEDQKQYNDVFGKHGVFLNMTIYLNDKHGSQITETVNFVSDGKGILRNLTLGKLKSNLLGKTVYDYEDFVEIDDNYKEYTKESIFNFITQKNSFKMIPFED